VRVFSDPEISNVCGNENGDKGCSPGLRFEAQYQCCQQPRDPNESHVFLAAGYVALIGQKNVGEQRESGPIHQFRFHVQINSYCC